MDLAILGWGSALPPLPVAQTEAANFALHLNGLTADQARLLPALYRRTEIRTKHSVLAQAGPDGGVTQDFYPPARDPADRGPTTRARMQAYAAAALPLAAAAARQALEAAALPAASITHIVTVSCSGFDAPGVDIGLIGALGLPPTVERAQIGFMGCHGALNGLKVAAGFAALAPTARVLLCAVELCSLHYQYGWDPDRIVANALFADGAAAVVAAPAPSEARTRASAFPVTPQSAIRNPQLAWRLAATGSCLFPDALDAMTWSIGDHGFEMALSPRVPGLIEANLRPWLELWLSALGLSLDSVGSWAIHPGGPRIVRAVEQTLGLPPGAAAVSREVLARCGNMSSPTILFILQRLAAAAAPRPCVAIAFGPGLVAEAALFR